jgi:hypothetical protein
VRGLLNEGTMRDGTVPMGLISMYSGSKFANPTVRLDAVFKDHGHNFHKSVSIMSISSFLNPFSASPSFGTLASDE